MYVCKACTVVSLSTTNVDFNTPPLAWTAPFDARTREPNVEEKLERVQEARVLIDS